MLSKGSSQRWDEALEAVTGTKVINATALMTYFQPLIEYLSQENLKNGETLGWPEMYTPLGKGINFANHQNKPDP